MVNEAVGLLGAARRGLCPQREEKGMRSPSHLCGFSPEEGPQELSQGQDRPDLKPQGGPLGLGKG